MPATVKPPAVVEPEPEGPVEQSDELDAIERSLANMSIWPPWPRGEGHEARVEALCLRRHTLLRDTGRRQDLAAARRHLAETTVRCRCATMVLGFPTHTMNAAGTLCHWLEQFDPSWAPAIREAATGPLAAVLEAVEPALRECWLQRDCQRYFTLAAPLPALEARATAELAFGEAFWGEGKGKGKGKGPSPGPAAVELAALRRELEEFRTQAHTAVGYRLTALRERAAEGDLLMLLEVIEVEAGSPGTLPLAQVELRQKLASILVAIAERLVPVGMDWPPPPRPAPPPESKTWWEPRI